ncbi:MAG: hypothetical protein MJ168_03975 [Clostridia bacterium]|nr:hypothetical protein [Clostridia bacterium]
MKKYLKIFPLVLHPYLNYIWVAAWLLLMNTDISSDITATAMLVLFFGSLTIFYIYITAIGIASIIKAAKGKQSACDSAKMNLLIKGCQIPAYIINFVVGILSPLAGHFGIIAGVFIVVADIIAISMSGLFSVSCAVAFRKEKLQSKALSLITGILSFVFCIDVAVAIYYFVKTSKKIKAGKNVISNCVKPDSIINSKFQGGTQ